MSKKFVLFALLVSLNLVFASSFDQRIINGTEALPFAYPFLCTIFWNDPAIQTFRHLCGSTIINDRWLSTAAHCIRLNPIILNDYFLYCGKFNIEFWEPEQQSFRLEYIVVHEEWIARYPDLMRYAYDIALIKTTNRIVFTAAIQPITLTTDLIYPSGSATIMGWGAYILEELIRPKRLRRAYVKILSFDLCAAYFGGENLSNNNICVDPVDGVGVCSGDSGGPLVVSGQNDEWTHIGIASFTGDTCGSSPSVFISIAKMHDWIMDVIEKN